MYDDYINISIYMLFGPLIGSYSNDISFSHQSSTLMKYKMLVVKAEEQVIRLFPALIVLKKEIDEAATKIEQACKEMS